MYNILYIMSLMNYIMFNKTYRVSIYPDIRRNKWLIRNEKQWR